MKERVGMTVQNLLGMHGKGSKCGWSMKMMNVMCKCQLKYQMDGVERMRSSGVCMVKGMMKLKRENEDF